MSAGKEACLRGNRAKIRPGSKISLDRLNKKEEFHVEWSGEDRTAGAGQLGVSAVGSRSSLWDDVLRARSQDGLARPELNSGNVPMKPKARARGA
jgi:hypothetical protein